jgi:hypothetical protein
MIDTLFRHKERALAAAPWTSFGVTPGHYALVTLHRPANVDDDAALSRTLDMLAAIAQEIPLLFPVHPRTRARLGHRAITGLNLVEPQPYLAFTGLMAQAAFVLTDSGGVQEETTALGVPCITMRDNTERPVTVDEGSNILAGTDPQKVLPIVMATLSSSRAPPTSWPAAPKTPSSSSSSCRRRRRRLRRRRRRCRRAARRWGTCGAGCSPPTPLRARRSVVTFPAAAPGGRGAVAGRRQLRCSLRGGSARPAASPARWRLRGPSSSAG